MYNTSVADRTAVAGFPSKKINGTILTASSRVVGSSGITALAAGGHVAHFTTPLAKREVVSWRGSLVSKRRPLAKHKSLNPSALGMPNMFETIMSTGSP
jgi:hypothetical protein